MSGEGLPPTLASQLGVIQTGPMQYQGWVSVEGHERAMGPTFDNFDDAAEFVATTLRECMDDALIELGYRPPVSLDVRGMDLSMGEGA